MKRPESFQRKLALRWPLRLPLLREPAATLLLTRDFPEFSMPKLFAVLLLSLLSSISSAADNPDWAYPVNPPPAQLDSVTLKSLPGSTKQYTQAQIDDSLNPPDWFPEEHLPLPPVVASGGTRPRVACGLCHLPSGNGHPESASLAGLNANYMIRQMHAFKAGDRKGVRA